MDHPSMMPGRSASHGNMWNTGERKESGPDRLPATAYRAFLSTSAQDPRLDAGSRETSSSSNSETEQLPGPQQQAVAGAGQTVSTRLFTRRAGVHVDFHAHRHFHDLRSFPTHEGLPSSVWHDVRAGSETRWTSNVAQARNIRPRSIWTHLTPAISLLGKASSLLDKGNE